MAFPRCSVTDDGMAAGIGVGSVMGRGAEDTVTGKATGAVGGATATGADGGRSAEMGVTAEDAMRNGEFSIGTGEVVGMAHGGGGFAADAADGICAGMETANSCVKGTVATVLLAAAAGLA